MKRRTSRRSIAALAALIAVLAAAPAQAHHAEPTGLEAITAGLTNAGLMPGSTSLGAPLGDAAPSQQAASVSSPDAESPLRVYVLVVDGLLPTQVGAQTPKLSELKGASTWYAQSRSVLPAETLPNHAAMATGVVPQKNGIVANQITRGHTPKEYMQHPEFWDADTIVTRLERAYRGKIDTATILGKEYLWGLFRGEFEGAGDPRAQREADFHWDPRTGEGYVPSPSSHVLDQYTMEALLAWLETEEKSTRPQFAFVNLADVDRAGHADAEGAALAQADRAANNKDELSGAFSTPFQQAALTSTDRQIGLFIDALKNGGHWDESVLILLSDHGMDWGPPPNIAETQSSLVANGYLPNDQDDGGGTGDYKALGGGGSELIYVYDESNIAPMARVLCQEAAGVAVVSTREPVSDLNADPSNPTCKGRTHGELGIDHPYSADIEVFLEPTWRSSPQNQSENPLPGNHGHAVTQHNTLFVTGGHPALAALDEQKTVPGSELVYKRNDVALPGGPGVLSVAPTVAALFGIGKPAGGYDAPPLTEAFKPGTLDLSTTELVKPTPAGGGEDHGAPDGDEAAKPVLTVGLDVADATLTKATYTLYVANRGKDVARDVMLTNAVPARTTFASAVGTAGCVAGSAPATQCRWSMGDLQPGQSKTVDVTYNLTGTTTGTVTNSVSAQLAGAAPNANDPVDTDSTLQRAVRTLGDDTHVDRAATADKNYGGCNQLEVGAGNALTAFLDDDGAFRDEAGATSLQSRTDELYAAQLEATTKTMTAPGGGAVQISAHRISSADWREGLGNCGGALENGNPANGRDADSGSVPVSDAGPLSTASATGPGERLAWDVTAALDDRGRRRDFNGLELRLFEGSAAGGSSTALHSGEAATANQPRLVYVRTIDNEGRCVSADPETATRNSDQVQRIRAYVTKTQRSTARPTSGGVDVCNGTPISGASVGWEIDDDFPDAYISSLAGHPTDRETGANGGASPDRGSTTTGPSGRTFIDVRLADSYPGGATPAATRVAAIALDFEHDAYFVGNANRTGQGVCDPGEPAAFSTGPQTCSGSGESVDEDDVATTWKPVPRPPDPGPGGVDDGGGGGDTNTGGANGIDGVDGQPAPAGEPTAGEPTAGEPPRTGESTTPSSPKRGRVTIRRGKLRMSAKRVVRVPLKCSKLPAGGCAGRVTLAYKKRVVGKRRYKLTAGQRRGVRVRIGRRAARTIRGHRAVTVRLKATNGRQTASRRSRLVH